MTLLEDFRRLLNDHANAAGSFDLAALNAAGTELFAAYRDRMAEVVELTAELAAARRECERLRKWRELVVGTGTENL